MRHLRQAAFVLALAVAARVAAAQDPPADDQELTISTRTHLAGGAGYGGPLGAAIMGELLYGLGADVREDEERVRGLAGLLVQVHAGSGGGKVSLGAGGRARVDSDDFKGAVAAGLKLSLARTWASPAGSKSRTYLGPELDLSVMHVGLSLGPLFRVGGAGGGGVLLSWDIGVRF